MQSLINLWFLPPHPLPRPVPGCTSRVDVKLFASAIAWPLWLPRSFRWISRHSLGWSHSHGVPSAGFPGPETLCSGIRRKQLKDLPDTGPHSPEELRSQRSGWGCCTDQTGWCCSTARSTWVRPTVWGRSVQVLGKITPRLNQCTTSESVQQYDCQRHNHQKSSYQR